MNEKRGGGGGRGEREREREMGGGELNDEAVRRDKRSIRVRGMEGNGLSERGDE